MRTSPSVQRAVPVTVCRTLTLANEVLRPLSNGQAARRAACALPTAAARMLMCACERMRHACRHEAPCACAAAPRKAADTAGTAAAAPTKTLATVLMPDSSTIRSLCNALQNTRVVREATR